MSEDSNKDFIEARDRVLENVISFLDDPERSTFEFSEPELTEDKVIVIIEKEGVDRININTQILNRICPYTGDEIYIVFNMFMTDSKFALKRARKATERLAKTILNSSVFNVISDIEVVVRGLPKEDLSGIYERVEYFLTRRKGGTFIHSEGHEKGKYLAHRLSEEEWTSLVADIRGVKFFHEKSGGEVLND